MSKKEVVCEKAPSAIGTYSQAVIAGNFIFVSGQIPMDSYVNGYGFERNQAARQRKSK